MMATSFALRYLPAAVGVKNTYRSEAGVLSWPSQDASKTGLSTLEAKSGQPELLFGRWPPMLGRINKLF